MKLIKKLVILLCIDRNIIELIIVDLCTKKTTHKDLSRTKVVNQLRLGILPLGNHNQVFQFIDEKLKIKNQGKTY